MEKMLKRRQGAEVKEEDQEKRSQEDKSDKPHDLGIIHPSLSYFAKVFNSP
jgi:hypothetical protein